MQKIKLPFSSIFLGVLFTFTVGCQKETEEPGLLETPEVIAIKKKSAVSSQNSRVITDWQDLFLKVERNAAVYRPCPAARMLAYVGLGAYETCISGMPSYKSLAPNFPGLSIPAIETGKEYCYPIALNSLYHALYENFFPLVQASDLAAIDSTENALNTILSKGVKPNVIARSKAYGEAVAVAIWAYENTDASGHDQYTNPRPASYIPPSGAGLWKPTPPGNQAAMFPYWGNCRTFAISGSEKLCIPPIPFSTDTTSQYYAQALEVYNSTTPQTSEHQWIAEFWSDDVLGFTFSPPSRWISIANQAIKKAQANLETAVLAAVKVGLALNDASVGCWNSKYFYNVERPATYITETMGHTSWNVADLTSTHFLTSTPSFPAYPSGHSTFGGAAAAVLSSVFGNHFHMTDNSHIDRTDFNGTPRSFSSFNAMAEENAYSRIWLGVHFRMDCEVGLNYGYAIGQKVNALPFNK